MAGLKSIKLKIRSTEKTRKVTKAMEAVSAAKMRKSQQRALAGRAYARAAVSILSRVSGTQELMNHPLVRVTSSNPTALYIVITSDKGLAGALNSAVLRATLADLQANGFSKNNTKITAIGKKANEFFKARGFDVNTYHPNNDQIDPELIAQIVHASGTLFSEGLFSEVKISYQNFISTFEQRPTLRTIFPLSLQELQKVVEDIVPVKGLFSQPDKERASSTYTIEPSEADIMNAILPRLAGIFLYHALLEAQASEHSARMVSMKSASDKAGEMKHSLTLQFNKARQAAITREVSEITGGMEAVAS